MRIVLAIELSTSRGQIALARGDEVLFEETFTSERSHNSRLYAPLGRALREAGTGLGLIVVGTGPGSYTGVRIGIASAQGIALARSVPVIGWPSVGAPEEVDETSFFVVGDARRGGFYVFDFPEKIPPQAPLLLTEPDFRRWHLERGPGRVICFDPVIPLRLADIELCHPSALKLARIGSSLAEADLARLASRPLEPLYVREAFITKAKRPFAI